MMTLVKAPAAAAMMTTDDVGMMTEEEWTSHAPVSHHHQLTVFQFQAIAPYIYTAIGIVGVASNMAVAYILKTSTVLNRRLENRLLCHQSVIDGLTGLFLALNMTSDLLTDYTGLLGSLMCKFWHSSAPLWIAMQASICNLVVITIDRYVEVVHKKIHRKYSSRALARASLVALPWVFAIGSSLPFIMLKNSVEMQKCVYGGGWPSQWVMRLSITLNVGDKYVVPLLVYLFCYTRMIVILKRNRNFFACVAASQKSIKLIENVERVRRNIVHTVLMVSLAHVICWTPNQILYMASQVFGVHVDRTGAPYNASVIAVYINCCISPFIYITCYAAFKHEVARRCRCHVTCWLL